MKTPTMQGSRKCQLPTKAQFASKQTRRTSPTLTSDEPRPLTTADIPTIVNAVLDARHHQPPVAHDDPPAPGPDHAAAAAALLVTKLSKGWPVMLESTSQTTSEDPSDFIKLLLMCAHSCIIHMLNPTTLLFLHEQTCYSEKYTKWYYMCNNYHAFSTEPIAKWSSTTARTSDGGATNISSPLTANNQ